MSDFEIKAWVFIDFGVNLWENPEKARALAKWKVIFNKNKASKMAKRLGMDETYMLYMLYTSFDSTKRMFTVLKSGSEEIKNWDRYVRNYIDNLTNGLQNQTLKSGCGCGMLTGGCGCGSECAKEASHGA